VRAFPQRGRCLAVSFHAGHSEVSASWRADNAAAAPASADDRDIVCFVLECALHFALESVVFQAVQLARFGRITENHRPLSREYYTVTG
jgi:hypothetical protein